jgi:hypothetical protein
MEMLNQRDRQVNKDQRTIHCFTSHFLYDLYQIETSSLDGQIRHQRHDYNRVSNEMVRLRNYLDFSKVNMIFPVKIPQDNYWGVIVVKTSDNIIEFWQPKTSSQIPSNTNYQTLFIKGVQTLMNNVCPGLHFKIKKVIHTPINFEINDSGLYVLAKATYTVYGEKYYDTEVRLSNFRNAINYSFRRGFLSHYFHEVGLRCSSKY